MNKALVLVNGVEAGVFEKLNNGKYKFTYHHDYCDAPISFTMPLTNASYEFDHFPAFFDGLLPEGILLEALLRKYKLDRDDYFGQLIKVGRDVVGWVSIEGIA